MKKLLIIFLFALAISPNLSAKTKLSLVQGTMKAGGRIQMPITIPREGDTIVGLDISPNFDYFVAKSFAIGFSPSVERKSLTGKNIPWSFSLGLSGTYHFDLGGTIYPYVGAGAGISWKTEVKGINFALSAPVGILVALNNHVAIDFGVPIKFIFSGEGFLGALLPIGYLGVQAFF